MDIFDERIIINGENKIGATVSYSDYFKKRPLVLLIMGTGKLDRDGNMKGFKSDLYKDLSDMFVRMGYTCIRYDKRGTHESTGNFNSAGLSDLVNDSATVIEYAKNLPCVDENRIIACGHSEGAMIATLLTKQQKLESVILLGGACMCLKSAMEYQNYKVLDEFKDKKGLLAWILNKTLSKEKIEKQLTSLYDKAKKSKKDTFFFRGAFLPSKWIKEHGSFSDEDYIKMIEEYNGKVLAITGKSDLQADYTCLDRIAEFENVTTYVPENVNHMLKEIDDDNSLLNVQKQYKRLAKNPIHEGTKKQVEDFLNLK
ncbi:MAG: alpha/beta hydrolase [Clostridia bacterium]|nr:alpha/beta hydrolase [Clostridia bacterium]